MKQMVFLVAVIFLFSGCASLPTQIENPDGENSQTAAQENALGRSALGQSSKYIPPPPTPTTKTAQLLVVGDLMVHGQQLAEGYNSQTKEYDFTHCFEKVKADIAAADYAIGNLETVLGGKDIGYSDYPQFNSPDSYGQAIAGAGFDFVTTANNHCLDKYSPGLLRTLTTLDSFSIEHTGTYPTKQESGEIFLKDINGIKIAFLSFTYGTNGIPTPKGQEFMVDVISEENIIKKLAAARALKPDMIVLLPHMGNEYELAPLPIFKDWMDLFFYHGADIILASHPHVLQPMETKQLTDIEGNTKDRFVIYSLGNFISSQRDTPREVSIMLKLGISKVGDGAAKLETVSFIPTWVQFYSSGGGGLIRVLPIADALFDYHGANLLQIRPQDANRLVAAHRDITKMYLGKAVPQDKMDREYLFSISK